MATINKLPITVPAGQFLSGMVDPAGNFVVGLIMPPAWTTAHVTVLVSPDDINFCDLFSYGSSGTSASEFKFNVTPGAMVAINPDTMLMARYFKLRSGTRDEPVIQEAARVFTAITVNRVTATEIVSEGETA